MKIENSSPDDDRMDPNTSLIIRRAKSSDLNGLINIVQNCFEETDNQRILGDRVLYSVYDLVLSSDDSFVFVAEVSGVIAGFSWVQVSEPSIGECLLHPIKLFKLILTLFIKNKLLIFWKINSKYSGNQQAVDCPRIITLAVDPAFQRRGCGQKLLDECIHQLRTCNSESCFVSTASNNQKAIRFYEKSGFTQINNHLSETLLRFKLLA